jgi:dTDP-4-dehydrorhamnose reductase
MRFLVTGASGLLGGYLLRELRAAGAVVVASTGSHAGELFGYPLRPVDLAEPDEVARAFREARPSVVIHAAAVAAVAACYEDPGRARRVNAEGTARLAGLAAGPGARLVYISTDLVFDGGRGMYREADPPCPLSVYGRTKVAAEEAARACPGSAVVRVSLLFGPSLSGRPSFFDQQVEALRLQRPVTRFEDEWRTPLGLTTAARALVGIAGSGVEGLLHLGGPERMTRLEMGRRLAALLGADQSLLVPTCRASAPSAEPRPRDTSLDSSLWRGLFPREPWPCWEEALGEMMPTR